jgi:hypothetical protein
MKERCLFSWRNLAFALAIVSLSLSVANRRFHWFGIEGILVQAHSVTATTQHLADDGHHWPVPAVTLLFRAPRRERYIRPQTPRLITVQSDNYSYDRAPPAA